MNFSCKKVLLFLSICFVTLELFSQTDAEKKQRDSLKLIYTSLSVAKEKLSALQKIADYELRFGAFERTPKYFVDHYLKEFVELGVQNNYYNIEAYQHWYVGSIALEASKFDVALSEIKKSINLFDKQNKRICHLVSLMRQPYNALNFQSERIQFYTQKLDYYLRKGQIENAASCIHGQAGYFRLNSALNIAISKYLKAADLYLSENNFIGYNNGIGVVGQTYLEWGNPERALVYLQKALSIALPKKDSTRLATIYIGFGDYYFSLEKYQNAYNSYDSVLLMAHNISGYFLSARLKQAICLLELRRLRDALDKISSVEKLKDSLKLSIVNSQGSIEVEYAYFNYYKSIRDDLTAQKYIFKAYEAATSAKSNLLRLKYLPILIDFLHKKGNKDEALRFNDTLVALNKEIDITQTPFKIAYYESEKKEREQLDSLTQLKEEKALQTAVIKKNTILLWVFIIALLLVTAAAFFAYREFRKSKAANKALQDAQQQLIQSEKMASLGELTAGIAHEIQNPLNFVNNFSEVSRELVEELKIERSKVETIRDKGLEEELMSDIDSNLEKINHHGQRAAAIVKGMLQHSRTSTGQKELSDINALCDEYLRLAYHGLRAKDKNFSAEFKTDFDASIPKINIVAQDIGRVVLNLINNAFFAVSERGKVEALSNKEEAILSSSYHTPYTPVVTVSTKNLDNKIEIRVADNGIGIPDAIKEKIFQPFFTTKPTGEGTGLGLSLSYDIIKAAGGEIKINSSKDAGATFSIYLPTS